MQKFAKHHKIFTGLIVFLMMLLLFMGVTLVKQHFYDPHRAYEDSLNILARNGFKREDVIPRSSVSRFQSFFGEPVTYSFEFVTKDSMRESKQYLEKHGKKTSNLTAVNAPIYYDVECYQATDKMAQLDHITGWVVDISKQVGGHSEYDPKTLQ